MSTSVEDIRRSAGNKYREFLREKVNETLLSSPVSFFPWVYKGSKGKRGDSYKDSLSLYSVLYSSSREKTGRGYSLITEKVNTRSYGEQTVIKEIAILREDDYLSFIGKEKEYRIFFSSLISLKDAFLEYDYALSDLALWATDNLDILSIKKEIGYYKDLVRVLDWLINNPESNLYIREIPLSVHTKFIEENEKSILSLYTAVTKKDPLSSFEETFSLKRKEHLVRYRMMNNREETGLRVRDFATLKSVEIKRVYVVENEIVYLTFPLERESMIIFGGGFASSVLSSVEWLKTKEIYYFGDMDEHGYEILSIFRSHFPSTQSFLMDRETYRDHIEYGVRGKKSPAQYDDLLTEEEKSVLELLRCNPEKSRIEQERISLEYIKKHLPRD